MNIPTELLVTISGIRGFAPEVLTPEIAAAFAAAFAQVSPEGPIIVSRDSRKSGEVLKKAVINALVASGREVWDADLVPLPTTQMAVEHMGAAGAIDVTASHNPAEYNGLKFLASNGRFITQETLDAMKAALSDAVADNADASASRSIQDKAAQFHLDTVLEAAIPGKRFTVAVDAVNGAGSYIVPALLEKLGCEVLPLATDPTQPFPHTPEPLPINLQWTADHLKDKQFDLCVVVDPDADRLVLLDEQAACIPEESTIPLVAKELMESGKKGTIVINLSTSRMTEDVAADYGCTVVRSAVGERNVVSKMEEVGAFFGAEGGGGIIDPAVHYGRDSLIGIVQVINLMRRSGKTISQLVAELPCYSMRKHKIPLSESLDLQALYGHAEIVFADGEFDRTDGLRISWPDRWIHIRPSNTEPIVRVIAEAPTDEEVDELVARANP